MNGALNKDKATFPIDPDCEIFRWGPLACRYFFIADYLYALTIGYSKRWMESFWPKGIVLFHASELAWIHDFAELRDTGAKVFENHVRTKDYKDQKQAWNIALLELQNQEERIKSKDLSKLSDRALAALLRDTNKKVADFWLPTLPAELGNYGSIETLQKELSRFIRDEKTRQEALRTLTTSEKLSFYQEEEVALQETDDLHAHQQSYFWLQNSYASVAYLDEDFFRKRKSALKPDLRNEYKRRSENIRKEKEEVIKDNKLPETLVEIAHRIVDAMEWQDGRKREVWMLQHYKELLLNEVAARTGEKDLERFGLWELAEILTGATIERHESFGFIMEEGQITEIDESTAERYWGIYTKEKITDSTVIKGTIANKGRATGTVRIVKDPRDSALSFNEGDVLVAPMTSPDYVFLMRKSSAVVTDTGGLTSHAAIISRELGKPCVIGTKIATHVLKNGDRAEVDADNGVVRILNGAGGEI